MTQVNTHFIGFAARPRREIPVLVAGANRGARETVPVFGRYNTQSDAVTLLPIYADPVPGRAKAMVEYAGRLGVSARGIEARAEEVLRAGELPPTAPVMLHLDRATAIRNVLDVVAGQGRAVLGYLLLKAPSKRLWGLRFLVEPGDEPARAGAARLFDRIADVSERGGSDAIFGPGADPADMLAEPVFRRGFGEHAGANLAKLVACIEPVTGSMEVTTAAGRARPLFVNFSGAWGDPETLGRALVDAPSAPIRRGSDFVLAEAAPAGLRLHEMNLRLDAQLRVRGSDTFDRAFADAERARREVLAREQAEREGRMRSGGQGAGASLVALLFLAVSMLSRAEQTTLTRSNPVHTTD